MDDAPQDDWLRAARMEALEAEVRRLQAIEARYWPTDMLRANHARLRRFVTLVAQPDASLPPYLTDDEVYNAPVSVGDVRAARAWLMETPAAPEADTAAAHDAGSA